MSDNNILLSYVKDSQNDQEIKLNLKKCTEKKLAFSCKKSPHLDDELSLSLFADEPREFRAKVIEVGEEYFELESEDKMYEKYSKQLLEARKQGLKIRKMNSERISTKFKGEPFWFYQDPEHEIFFLVNNNVMSFLQLNYQGNILEVNENQFISSGELIESKTKLHLGSNLIGAKKMFSYDVFDSMLTFVKYIPKLTEIYKNQIEKVILKARDQEN